MDDDSKKGKKQSGGLFRRMFSGSAWSLSSSDTLQQSMLTTPSTNERRPLKSIDYSGPNFKLHSKFLAKDYVEKEARYMGTLSDIKKDFDARNRAVLLSLLDEKRRYGFVSVHLSRRHDAIISCSVYNIKIMWRDGDEELIHRIPIHQIASTGFVQDDDKRIILFIKFALHAIDQTCSIAFFLCDTMTSAQEICCLTQQFFQLAFTSSTMDFFDKSIRDGALTPNQHSCSTDGSSGKRETITMYLGTHKTRKTNSDLLEVQSMRDGTPTRISISKSSTLPIYLSHQQSTNARNGDMASFASTSTRSSSSSSRRARRSGSSTSSHDTPRQHMQLHEYIQVLQERLSTDEIRQFAELLHYFRTDAITIQSFCDQLMKIYTEQRKSLILGMRHFIPDAKDLLYFDSYLHQHNIESDDVRWWDSPPISHSTSEKECSKASLLSQTHRENGSPCISSKVDIKTNHTSTMKKNLIFESDFGSSPVLKPRLTNEVDIFLETERKRKGKSLSTSELHSGLVTSLKHLNDKGHRFKPQRMTYEYSSLPSKFIGKHAKTATKKT